MSTPLGTLYTFVLPPCSHTQAGQVRLQCIRLLNSKPAQTISTYSNFIASRSGYCAYPHTRTHHVHPYVQLTASTTNIPKFRHSTVSFFTHRKAKEQSQQPKDHGEEEDNHRAQALRNTRRPLQNDVWNRGLRRGGRRASTAEQACELAPNVKPMVCTTFVRICSISFTARMGMARTFQEFGSWIGFLFSFYTKLYVRLEHKLPGILCRIRNAQRVG